ncbi:MAG: MFS transporter [Actinomycetota bacterium]
MEGNGGRTARGRIRRLAFATGVSGTGDWAASVALSLLVFAETHSTIWLSASFFFIQAPKGFLSPVAGMVADRFDRRRVIVVCALLSGAAYVAMVATREPVWLIALGSLAALVDLPAGPAAIAAVPNLVGEDELSWANGTVSAAFRLGTLIGPALGGALYAFAGAGSVFALNAVSFLASAVVVARISGAFHSTAEPTGQTEGVWEGLRFIRRTPVILALAVVGAVTFLAAEISLVAELPLIHDFGVGGLGYGVMNTAWGAGGFAGAVIAARVVRERWEPAAAVGGILFFGLFLGLIGVSPVFVLVPVFSFLYAWSDAFSFLGYAGIVQRQTHDAIRGRVFAGMSGLNALATLLAFSVSGFIVGAVGWRPTYVVGGLINVGCGIALWIALRLRGSSTTEGGDADESAVRIQSEAPPIVEPS